MKENIYVLLELYLKIFKYLYIRIDAFEVIFVLLPFPAMNRGFFSYVISIFPGAQKTTWFPLPTSKSDQKFENGSEF